MVGKLNPKNKVDLTNPELTIVVEVIKAVCCLSVVKDYSLYRKYNVQEVVKEDTPKPDAETETPGEKDEKETNKEEKETNKEEKKDEKETKKDEKATNKEEKKDEEEMNKDEEEKKKGEEDGDNNVPHDKKEDEGDGK